MRGENRAGTRASTPRSIPAQGPADRARSALLRPGSIEHAKFGTMSFCHRHRRRGAVRGQSAPGTGSSARQAGRCLLSGPCRYSRLRGQRRTYNVLPAGRPSENEQGCPHARGEGFHHGRGSPIPAADSAAGSLGAWRSRMDHQRRGSPKGAARIVCWALGNKVSPLGSVRTLRY